jgi:Domain of unknown function (DUF4365)
MPRYANLGMARTAQQEGFGDAYLLAVAGAAGCATSLRRPDDDSIDWTLSCRLSLRPKLDIQMKTTTTADEDGDTIQYPLKVKNYNDLVITDILVPRILILVLLPPQVEEWLAVSSTELILRHCSYWTSLRGRPTSDNEYTVTVPIPRANMFTVEALCTMMTQINEGGAPRVPPLMVVEAAVPPDAM